MGLREEHLRMGAWFFKKAKELYKSVDTADNEDDVYGWYMLSSESLLLSFDHAIKAFIAKYYPEMLEIGRLERIDLLFTNEIVIMLNDYEIDALNIVYKILETRNRIVYLSKETYLTDVREKGLNELNKQIKEAKYAINIITRL
ncbi:MAG TPA: hypothetical protein EYP22_08020 [Methanosarcinales archaeon]|nr:hypothetical protein [Methanosarcinales archaeon]